MTEIHLDSVVQPASGSVACDIAEETAILDLASGVYYGLNHTGSVIWERLQQPTPVRVRDILGWLLERFDVEPTRCEADLLKLVSQLRTESLIYVYPSKPP